MTNIDVNKNFYNSYSFEDYYSQFIKGEKNYDLYINRIELNMISEKLDSPLVRSVLLVGVGFGRELDHILKISPHCIVHVLDFSTLFIESARKIYNDARVKLYQVDLNDGVLPFSDGSIDLIICFNTLEYIEDKSFQNFFKESDRILTSGGTLIFRLLNKTFPFAFIDEKHQKTRSSDKPRLHFRSYFVCMTELNKYFNCITMKPLSFKIESRLITIFYSNFLLRIGILMESCLRKILPLKFFKSVYFMVQKSI